MWFKILKIFVIINEPYDIRRRRSTQSVIPLKITCWNLKQSTYLASNMARFQLLCFKNIMYKLELTIAREMKNPVLYHLFDEAVPKVLRIKSHVLYYFYQNRFISIVLGIFIIIIIT